MPARPPKLLVGVGNVLRRDDGVGVYVARVLASLPLSADVEVYDAGTLGLDLASILEHRARVVIVDAIEAAGEPGAVFRLEPQELRPYARSEISLHDVHLLDALDETQLLGNAPREVVVLAVQVADVSAGIGLSPAVARALRHVVNLAVKELGVAGWVLSGTRNVRRLCQPEHISMALFEEGTPWN